MSPKTMAAQIEYRVSDLTIPDYIRWGRERYFLFHSDGSFAWQTNVQRPAAIRAACQKGHGVYDKRKHRIIHQPNPKKELDLLAEHIDRLHTRLGEARERREAIIAKTRALAGVPQS